jgi:hypothetical protein
VNGTWNDFERNVSRPILRCLPQILLERLEPNQEKLRIVGNFVECQAVYIANANPSYIKKPKD